MGPLVMDESDRKEYQSVILAGLLHDIGKLLHRKDNTAYKTKHNRASSLFIGEYEDKLRNDALYDLALVNFLSLHHMPNRGETKADVLSDPFLETSKIGKERAWKLVTLIRDADIYSCAERERDEEERTGFADRLEPLKPIFENLDLGPAGPQPQDHVNYHLSVLDPLRCFPDRFAKLSDREFDGLIGKFIRALPDFSKYTRFDDVINKWLDVLQQYTCCVPSDTRYNGPDVSLYDHSRSSAAFAACLYKRHLESIRSNKEFYRPREFILIGGDYSGIQDYIFHITNKGSGGASKRLRARSFFVYLFSEATIHKILHALDLPFVCNLFSAGGKFLVLAPNLEGIPETLERVKAEVHAEINTSYFNQFSFLLSWMEINGYKKEPELKNETGVYTFYKSAEKMFYRLEREKVGKFRSILIKGGAGTWNAEAFKATEMYGRYEERGDCAICGKGPGITDDVDPDTKEVTICCPACYRDKYLIGEKLPRTRVIAFGKGILTTPDVRDSAGKIVLFHSLKLPDDKRTQGYYVELLENSAPTHRHYLAYGLSQTDRARDDSQPPVLTKQYANHVPTEDNNILSFRGIAAKSLWTMNGRAYGSDMLGVLKVDIDNLGLLFSKGFERPSRREIDLPDVDRKTVSRFLMLSRMVDLFFSGWIKDIMTADKEEAIARLLEVGGVDRNNFENYLRSSSTDFSNIYTVYSGGDDLVLVGPWETMIVFAICMNSEFRRFTCENQHVTLSAGLALVKERHPIASAIKQADDLLKKSKENGKNAISLFDSTVRWERLPRLVNFFLFLNGELNRAESEINTAFLHRLLSYHRTALGFIDGRRTEALLYLSALSYDIGRNIIRKDKGGTQKEELDRYKELTNLTSEKPDRDSLVYNLKIPVFWALYRNRSSLQKRPNSIEGR